MTRKKNILHPFFFSLYPILHLFSVNADMVAWSELLQIGLCSALAAGLLFIIIRRFAEPHIAGLLTTLFLLFFFSYGHIHQPLKYWTFAGVEIGRHRVFLILYASVFLAAALVLIKSMKDLRPVTLFLNWFGAILLLFALAASGFKTIESRSIPIPLEAGADADLKPIYGKPNVFHIILDTYPRQDALKRVWQFDNSAFITALESRNFYIAHQGRSNYNQTLLSMPSCLNMNYLDPVVKQMGTETANRKPLSLLLKNNLVFSLFKKMGYQTITFANGIYATEIQNTDRFISNKSELSQFKNLLLNSTPLLPLMDLVPRELTNNASNMQYKVHRERLLFTFDEVPKLASSTTPVFVYAHILAPHPPIVFDKNGTPLNRPSDFTWDFDPARSRDDRIRRYTDYLQFVNTKVLAMIDGILENSRQPPIIVLQSDTGLIPDTDLEKLPPYVLNEEVRNLNTYYLPHGGQELFYPTMTPVNTFRLIFNYYFNGAFTPLSDRSYFAQYRTPYKLSEVLEN